MKRYSNSLILDSHTFSLKEYCNVNINIWPVSHCTKFAAWRHKNYIILSDGDYDYDNREIFHEKIGKHNFGVIIDGVIWFCWAVEYGEIIFLMFSSKKGTKYEVVYPGSHLNFCIDKAMAELVISFHQWLLKDIFGINNFCNL